MKIHLLVICFALACLTSCATRTSAADPFLRDCVIEGAHDSLDAVMEDDGSTVRSLYNFAGNAEDAVKRCNGQLESARKMLGVKR